MQREILAAANGVHALVAETAVRIGQLERLLTRVQGDVERIKLHANAVLGPQRALALLASGDRIYVDPRDQGCGINLLTEGKYEEEEIRLFRRLLKPGILILDIGANYGYYSIGAAPYVRPGGRIIGFEPNPHIHDLFRSSIYINGFSDVVEARRIGVHNSNGTLAFEIDEAGPGGAHVVAPTDRPPPGSLVIDVPVCRLDDHLPQDQIVDLVKIDVEGHEEHVLRGMQAVVRRSPNIVIFMEFFFPFFHGVEADFVRLIDFVRDDLGLRISRVFPGGRTTEVDVQSLRGATCTLILSKAAPTPMPDLSLYPAQLNRGPDVDLKDDALVWMRDGPADPQPRLLAHGPYVFLPKGRYRLVLDAAFEGEFLLKVQENYGNPLWEAPTGSCRGYAAELCIMIDAPRIEIVVWSTAGSRRLTFRRAEFWPLD